MNAKPHHPAKGAENAGGRLEQTRLFKLLADVYVHARYTRTYTITKEELDYLPDRVRRLQAITEEVRKEAIDEL